MYTCKHGCGYQRDHRGAMNLHEKFHCPTLNVSHETKADPPPKPNKEKCNHAWRFLDGRKSPQEQMAMREGYSQVCQICQTVQ